MIKNFEPRLYQETILDTASRNNTLVVLPTGLGKTLIGVMLASQRLSQYPESKVLFLAPTKPLAQQHVNTFRSHLDVDEDDVALFTGSTSPDERGELWSDKKVVVGTPQCVQNDIISDNIDVSEVSLLVFDEAHHATGDYSYCFIADRYVREASFPRVLGLTASPGSSKEKIREVCDNIHADRIEVRGLDDPDVEPYIEDIKKEWIKVELPDEILDVRDYLKDSYKSKLEKVKDFGYLNSVNLNKTDLLNVQSKLQSRISQGEKDGKIFKSVSLVSEALKLDHAIGLIETQDPEALLKYMEKVRKEAREGKSKAAKNLAEDTGFKSAWIKVNNLVDEGVVHPKIPELLDIVGSECGGESDKRVMVFTEFRDSASTIVDRVNQLKGVSAELFVGQNKKNGSGLTQKEQKEVLDRFRDDDFNVLVCTSVGEEGLDIPAVDTVVFYEPVPDSIRHIQRRGRTGRHETGSIKVLVAEDTKDEAYRWAAHNREKKMYRELKEMKKELESSSKNESLESYVGDDKEIAMVVDHREKGSKRVKELSSRGVSIDLKELDSADYLCSSECGVELKTVDDFVDSIVDDRLLDQVKGLSDNFSNPLLIIEGEGDIFSVRKVHPNSIRGMLSTIAVDFGVPILRTKDSTETAGLLSVIAKREQDRGSSPSLHGSSKPVRVEDQQEYIVSSLPSIGSETAKSLLDHFSSPLDVFTASEEELREVEGVGEKLASKIRNVLTSDYE